MKKTKAIVGAFLFLLAAWGIWYATIISITPSETEPYLEVAK